MSSGSREDCWPPTELPGDAQSDYPLIAQIFAYGAREPAYDLDIQGDGLLESDDYVTQSMLEVASLLSISAGTQVSVAMTVDKLSQKYKQMIWYKQWKVRSGCLEKVALGNSQGSSDFPEGRSPEGMSDDPRMSVLGLKSGYTVKYSLSTRKIPWAPPS